MEIPLESVQFSLGGLLFGGRTQRGPGTGSIPYPLNEQAVWGRATRKDVFLCGRNRSCAITLFVFCCRPNANKQPRGAAKNEPAYKQRSSKGEEDVTKAEASVRASHRWREVGLLRVV